MAKWDLSKIKKPADPIPAIARIDKEIAEVLDGGRPNTEIKISILPTRLSGNRVEYYVRITRGNVTYETNRYVEGFYNRALYERDMLDHVINGGPKPHLMDDKYADPEETPTQRLS